MADYEETKQIGSGSGLYRRLKASLFPVVGSVLFLILSGWLTALWTDSRDHSSRITILETKFTSEAENNAQFREWIRAEFREMKGDIKELLREIRK